MKPQDRRYLLLAVLTMFLVTAATMLWVTSAPRAWASEDTTALPDWLEPRGLSVIEMVGLVPDEFLKGTILSYGDWDGIVVYESGSRQGNHIVVNTTIYPRLDTPDWAPNNKLTLFGCLGQTPMRDHMGTVVPTSTLRVYDVSGADVTSQIEQMFVTRMELLQPLASSAYIWRYPEDRYGLNQDLPLPMSREGLVIPPNAGCWIKLFGADYYPLTGVFTLELEPTVNVRVLGTQKATFQSYIGVGNLGIFQPLMSQMRAIYPDRHGRIPLSIPPGTDHFLLKFPPTPGDPYTDSNRPPPYLNANRLSSGTYRLSRNISELSADLTSSAAFPLAVAWQDADQAKGSWFLPLIRNSTDLAPLEYVLPEGIPVNDCFWQGGCPPDLLKRIYEAEMTLEIIYLEVLRPETGGEWVPLRMAGPAWLPTGEIQTVDREPIVEAPETSTAVHKLFLPIVSRLKQEDPVGCLCGWFDDLGRMLDVASGEEVCTQGQ